MGALSSPWLKWQEQGALSMTLLFYPRQGFVGRFALQTPFGNFARDLSRSRLRNGCPKPAVRGCWYSKSATRLISVTTDRLKIA
jgi:hypothetical protein